MLKRSKYYWNRLPKSAVPCDKESYIGVPSHRHSGHPFKFVYLTKNKKYIIQRFVGVNSPISRYCIDRNPCTT